MSAPLHSAPSSRSKGVLLLGLFVAFVACFGVGAMGGFATTSSVNDWFLTLNKPSWNPPSWLFGPVWSTLYAMMACAVWLVWKNKRFSECRTAVLFFAFHLGLNLLWSILFFGLQQPGWAFAEIILLWISILTCIALFYRHSKLASYLLVPYLMWVSFAGFLNYTIWSLN